MFVSPPQDMAPYALKAELPLPSSTSPASVAVSSAAGADPAWSRGDHVHASKVRSQRITMPIAATTYTWTYPAPYLTGVVPSCFGIAQVATGNPDLFNIQVIGTPTNTQCIFQINRVSPGLLALLLGALSFNPNPVALTMHLVALEA